MNKDQIIQVLNETENDSPVASRISKIPRKNNLQFVKMERPEGEGLDGRDGPERRSMGKIVDAAENHYFNMIKESHEKQELEEK
ncbi:hypothetical protein AL526_004580, partial [Citrobacter koseri]|uniref:hypothetical protein n=1 Tax=Citrobacter koseri TaxID=545 RepID=UPI000A6609A9